MKHLALTLLLMALSVAAAQAQQSQDEIDAYVALFHRTAFDRADGSRMQCTQQRPVALRAILEFLHAPRLQAILDAASSPDGWRAKRSRSARDRPIEVLVATMLSEYDEISVVESRVAAGGGFSSRCPERNELRSAASIIGAHMKEHLQDFPEGKIPVSGNALWRFLQEHPLGT